MKHLKVMWLWSLALCIALALVACQGENIGGSTSGDSGGSGTASNTVIIKGRVVVNIDVQAAATNTAATPGYLLAIPANGDSQKVSLDSTGSFTITVQDTTAPAIASVTPSTATLWPPNHQMVAITVNAVATDAVGVTSLKIISVTSSEPGGNCPIIRRSCTCSDWVPGPIRQAQGNPVPR